MDVYFYSKQFNFIVYSVNSCHSNRSNLLYIFSRAIHMFSLKDLEEGKIIFVHTGLPTSRLAFRVSDGQKVRKFKHYLSIFTAKKEKTWHSYATYMCCSFF